MLICSSIDQQCRLRLLWLTQRHTASLRSPGADIVNTEQRSFRLTAANSAHANSNYQQR